MSTEQSHVKKLEELVKGILIIGAKRVSDKSTEEIEPLINQHINGACARIDDLYHYYREELTYHAVKISEQNTLLNEMATVLEYFKDGLSDVEAGSGEEQPQLNTIKSVLQKFDNLKNR